MRHVNLSYYTVRIHLNKILLRYIMILYIFGNRRLMVEYIVY